MRDLILDLEWGFVGFIQSGYTSEPRGTGRIYWLTGGASRRDEKGVRQAWGLGIGGVKRCLDVCVCCPRVAERGADETDQ